MGFLIQQPILISFSLSLLYLIMKTFYLIIMIYKMNQQEMKIMVCEERREHNGLSFQQLLPGVCFFTFTFYKRQQHDSKGLAIQVQQVMNVLQEVQFQLEMVKRCSNRLLNAKSSYESILMAPPC